MTTTDPAAQPQDIYAAALNAHHHGVTVIPVRADGTKAPALRGWQKHSTTEQDLKTWFATGTFTAMGAVTGEPSGGLEMMEIEGRHGHLLDQLWDIAETTGAKELWDRINNGWVELSPSGGIHWFYRVQGQPVPGNTKLAQQPGPGGAGIDTIAETRGAGGQTVIAPSGGAAHPSGHPWRVLIGGPATIPTITGEERETLHGILATLDRRTSSNPVGGTPASRATMRSAGSLTGTLGTIEGLTPPDDYENKTDWRDILIPHGWTVSHTMGNTTYWTRPNKQHGISATTGRADDRDRLFVFTTSTEFPDFEPITKFGAYTILNHGGDYSAAARQLRADHYGEPDRKQAVTPAAPAGNTTGTHLHFEAAPAPATATGPAGAANVVQLPAREEEPAPAGPPALTLAATTLALTDDANGVDFVRDHHHRARYETTKGRWLVWDGTRWEPQPPATGGSARELAKHTARNLPETGAAGAEKAYRHKIYSLGNRGITAMLAMAATDPAITVATDQLDAHPLELNTPAGIIDLKTGQLLPADPARLHTKITKVSPDPGADPSRWHDFLAQTFPDPEVRAYTQKLIGHSLLGEVRAHVLPFAHGSGGNGKGVFLETIHHVLGDYAGAAPAGFLMQTPFAEHATELADLQGKRFVICSEVNQNDKFNEAKVKQLTGGDTIKARFMRQDFFEFTPTHSLWLMGNDRPGIDSGGDAFWRRLRLIPFTEKVPDHKKIDGLQEILATRHGAAVLWWAIQGAMIFLKDGLGDPPAGVRAATADYASAADTVAQFIKDECTLHPSISAPTTQIWAAYETWCHQNGETPLARRTFTTHLQRHGVKTGDQAPRRAGQRTYGGIGLRAADGMDPDQGFYV